MRELKNNLSEQAFKATDLSEVLTPEKIGKMKDKAKNQDDTSYLEYRLKTDEDGKVISEKIENGMFDFLKKVNFVFHTGRAQSLCHY